MATLSQTILWSVYNHAAGAFIGGTLTVPTVIVGYPSPVSSNTLTVYNTAAGPAGALQTTGSTSLSNVTLNNVNNVAAGGSGLLSATLAPGQGVGAFLQSNVTLTFADASTYSGAIGDLGTSTVTITGNVLDHASGSASNTVIGLPLVHAGYAGSIIGTSWASVFNAPGAGQPHDLRRNNVRRPVDQQRQRHRAGRQRSIGATLATGQPVGAINQGFTLAYADNSALPGASSNLGNLVITVTGAVYSGQAVWNATTGVWGASANWTDAVGGGPSGPPGLSGFAADTATFGSAAPAGNAFVALNGVAPVLSNLIFSNSNASYTIEQGTSTTGLTLTGTGGGSAAAVTVISGTHDVAVPILLQSNLDVISTGSVTFSDNVSDGGLAKSLTLSGGGTLILAGSDSYSGGTTVDAGTLILASTTAFPRGSKMAIGAGEHRSSPPRRSLPPRLSTASRRQFRPLRDRLRCPRPATLLLLAAGAVAAGFGIGGGGNLGHARTPCRTWRCVALKVHKVNLDPICRSSNSPRSAPRRP